MIRFQETHHSTAIEGNTLILKEVQTLLAEGRAVGDKELKEYLEVKGYADAADWVYSQATSNEAERDQPYLLLAELREVHRRVVGPAWDVAQPVDSSPARAPAASACTTSSVPWRDDADSFHGRTSSGD